MANETSSPLVTGQTSSTAKLWKPEKISSQIDKFVDMTKIGLEGLHIVGVQCLLHAEKHGDVSLIVKLIQRIKDDLQGVVVAGFHKWVKDYSPIKLEVSADGEVKGRLLKEDEEGFKEFQVGDAEDNPALHSDEVRDRANKPIEKPSIAMFKKRIEGFKKIIEKYNLKAPKGSEVTEDEARKMKAWITNVVRYAGKVTVLKDVTENSFVASDPKITTTGVTEPVLSQDATMVA